MSDDGFYEGRVVEAELEAIRLRKDDPNRTAIWLWPPFGPTEERERELTAPKATTPLHAFAQRGLPQSAMAQQAWMQQSLQNSIGGYGNAQAFANQQYAASQFDVLGLAGIGGIK